MKRTAMWTTAAVLALTGGLFAYQLAFEGGAGADRPGKLIRPITSEEICKDRCPLTGPDRPDCPGKIEHPRTGDLVRADRFPLGAEKAKADTFPSCCQGKK